ncbi:cobalamin-binding protein [Gemmatimonadota bacterium]|nr:cobalamin-binding protein [Gemmatimonadota bacterium]
MSLLVVIAACDTRPRDAAGTSYVVDDFGDSVRVGPARRIVSLNPVATEFLFVAGAGERVVGRTHWDHYPPAADAVPDLGNGIDPNVEAVLGAKPDLVILYMNASNRRAALGLQAAGVRTLTVRTDQIADLTRLADLFAAVTGDSAGRTAVDSVMRSVDAVRRMPRPATPPRAFWVLFDGGPQVWTMGRGSFMNELLEIAGATNVFGDIAAPSAQVSLEEVVKRNPDLFVVGPKTADRLKANSAWNATAAVRARRFAIVDSALVGRPGMRLGEAARHVRRLVVGDSTR